MTSITHRQQTPPAAAAPPSSSPSSSSSFANGKAAAAAALHNPANAKCPKLDRLGSVKDKKMENKFLANVKYKSKDDVRVPITARKSSKVQKERDPNHPPKTAALVNAKYVTYGRITRDLGSIWIT
jgi:hypothetical protein